MPGFKKISSGDNFAVYENTEFVPVGFAYSSYMTEEDFGKVYGISKANALMQGRAYVTPDDIKKAAHGVLRHRIALRYIASADGVTPDIVITNMLNSIPTP